MQERGHAVVRATPVRTLIRMSMNMPCTTMHMAPSSFFQASATDHSHAATARMRSWAW